MPVPASFDYAIVRVVPRVDREEFMNAGVILFSRVRRFLDASIALERSRLAAFGADLDLDQVERHLAAIPAIARGEPDAGEIARLPQAERFHWLVAPRSAVIQVSPVHTGVCDDPAAALERLMDSMVRPARSSESRPAGD